MPFWFADTCARRSLILSARHRVPLHPGYCAGSLYRSSVILSSLKRPSLTIFSLLIAAPSWKSSRECGGMLPAVIPPISAWCALDAA